MSANDKYKHYSAADIRKYLQGDLSAREMQALEAAALEDPFLADALEGIEKDRQLRGETAFREDLAGLKERLDLRIAKKNKGTVLPFYHSGWRAIAAIIILVSLGAITYRYVLHGRSSTPPLASAEAGKKDPPTDRLSSGAASDSSEIKDSGKMSTAKEDNAVAIPPSNLVQLPPSPKYSSSRQASESEKKAADAVVAILPDSVKNEIASTAVTDKTDKSKEFHSDSNTLAFSSSLLNSSPNLARSAFKTRDQRYKFGELPAVDVKPGGRGAESNSFFGDSATRRWRTNQYIVGKVTDGNNNPIPLVTISFSGHKQEIRTDNNGLFRVQMLGSDSSIHVRISSTGYETVELPAYVLTGGPASGGVTNTIRLLPQADGLSNATVMGYGTMKKTSQEKELPGLMQNSASGMGANPKSTVQQASPVSGWTAYKNYLEKNKRDRSIDSTKKGIEAISFNISKKGRLSSFKIEQSLSPAHDSLLLHLIRHGSAWKSLNGNNGSAIVVLSY